eukprot:s1_g983.t1
MIIAAALSVLTMAPAYADSGSVATDLSGAVSQPAVRLSAVGGSIVALPLMSVGSVGEELLETSATAMSRSLAGKGPLPISDRTVVTRRTPAEAMQNGDVEAEEAIK